MSLDPPRNVSGPIPPEVRNVDWRTPIFSGLQRTLLLMACAYLTLAVVSGHTYVRSYAFGIAAAITLWLILGALFSGAERIPLPDRFLAGSIFAWAGWSVASLAWSIHPVYTDNELRSEVGWGVATAMIFYVAARSAPAFRAMTTTAVAACVFLSGLAIYGAIETGSSDAEIVLSRSHGGAGAFSTYLVLVAPIMPLLMLARPAGFGRGWRTTIAVALAFILLLVAARLTENRMIWVTLGAAFVCTAVFAAWRWGGALRRKPLRWAAALAALLLVLAILFVDAASQRARTEHTPDTTVAQTLADDPRLALWRYTFERIGERPWLGYGFGKSILREEMQGELHDPFLVHAHNLFASQWIQTGAIGVATLLAMFGALAWGYLRFLRADDDILAMLGLMGLALLVGFVVKNITDDFMIRPTSKEFWALNALIIGWGTRRRLGLYGSG